MRLLFVFIILQSLLFAQILYGTEIIVPTDDYPPWKIVKDDQIAGGLDIALTNALLKSLAITPIYKLYPWKRCLLMMKTGEGDLISGVTKNEEREKYLVYLLPPYKTQSIKSLFVKKGTGNGYVELSDMEQKNIGYLRGARYFDDFHDNVNIIKTAVNSDLQGMKMVIAGRLQGFLITKENGEYLLQKNQQLREKLEQTNWKYNTKIEVYFAVSKKSRLLERKQEIEESLKILVNSGSVDRIIRDQLK